MLGHQGTVATGYSRRSPHCAGIGASIFTQDLNAVILTQVQVVARAVLRADNRSDDEYDNTLNAGLIRIITDSIAMR